MADGSGESIPSESRFMVGVVFPPLPNGDYDGGLILLGADDVGGGNFMQIGSAILRASANLELIAVANQVDQVPNVDAARDIMIRGLQQLQTETGAETFTVNNPDALGNLCRRFTSIEEAEAQKGFIPFGIMFGLYPG